MINILWPLRGLLLLLLLLLLLSLNFRCLLLSISYDRVKLIYMCLECS